MLRNSVGVFIYDLDALDKLEALEGPAWLENDRLMWEQHRSGNTAHGFISAWNFTHQPGLLSVEDLPYWKDYFAGEVGIELGVIYGEGGYARFAVSDEGEIVLDATSTRPEKVTKAQRLGFKIWGLKSNPRKTTQRNKQIQDIADWLPIGPCLDEPDDVTILVNAFRKAFGVLVPHEELLGLPYCTDNDSERLKIATILAKHLHNDSKSSTAGWPYLTSPNGRYILTRDGQIVMRGTELEVWDYLHRTHSYSIEHALRYEGYKLQPDLTLARENRRSM